MSAAFDPALALLLIAGSALATAALIAVLRPFLARYALARPGTRSSHVTPTPQGGGIAVIATILAVVLGAMALGTPGFGEPWANALLLATLGLAIAGMLDDVRPMPVLPRLLIQFAAAAALVLTLPSGARVLPWLPDALEQVVLIVGLVWFINLTNFMDGIDWITVAETAPICAAIVLAAALGLAPSTALALPVVLALLGAILGFAPFNRHVASLFLGDVGSLPIGALLGWLLILLAADGHLAAALILPLYYLADASITLIRRWHRGERLWVAHRTHFYQLAIQRGYTAPEVTTAIFGLNLLLAMLALGAMWAGSPLLSALALLAAAGVTGLVLARFEQGSR